MGSPKTVESTSKTEPWEGAKQPLLDLYAKAQSAFSQTNQKPYTGDLWAGPNATQKAANAALAGNTWGKGAGALNTLGFDTTSGKYLNPESNPYLKASVEGALSDVTNKYTREVLPGLGDQAIKAGAYGGGRQGIQEGLAAGEYSREANEAATNIYARNYEAERQRQMQGGSLFNQANALEQQQIGGQASAGSQQQQWDQGQLAENFQRYQMQQAAPWAGIPELLSVLTGGGFQSTQTTQPNPNYKSPLQTIMGLASSVVPMLSGFGGFGGAGAFPAAPVSSQGLTW